MAEQTFRFRQFKVRNRDSALKVGTDAVLLGAAMTLLPTDRLALDIGTGTGVIALMAAQRTERCSIIGIDIDPPSAAEAEENFRLSPWADRLTSVCTPLSGYRSADKFDVIFSNPPYYDCSLRNPDGREAAARHSGSLSVRDILAFASAQLNQSGRLSMILPSEQIRDITRCAASYGLKPFRLLNIRTSENKAVRRTVIELSSGGSRPEEEEITLMQGGERTEEYRRLTEDFYL